MLAKNLIPTFLIKGTKPVKMNWQNGFVKTQKAFDLYDKNLGILHVSVDNKYNELANSEKIFLTITNPFESRPLVQETIEFYKNKNIVGYDIEVSEKYREKHFGLGELMRLLSIAQMNENHSNLFRLYSRYSALGFHSKYKFQPNIADFNIFDAFLKKIAAEKSPYMKDFVDTAQKFDDENWTSVAFTNDWINKANAFINDYLEKLAELKIPREKHYMAIPFYVDMKLSRENLLKNKNFYNALFEKHGIDYKI